MAPRPSLAPAIPNVRRGRPKTTLAPGPSLAHAGSRFCKSPVRAGAALHDDAAAGGGELSESYARMRLHGLQQNSFACAPLRG